MKKKSLASNLVIIFSLIISVAFVVVGLIVSAVFNKQYLTEGKKILDNQLEVLEDSVLDYLDPNGISSYDDVMKVLLTTKSVLKMDTLIFDNQGYYYMASREKYQKYYYTKTLMPEEVMEELKSKNNIVTTHTNLDGKNINVYVKPIHYNNYFLGGILLVSDTDNAKIPNNIYYYIWTAITIVIIITNLIIYLFSKKLIIKPLSTINRAARKLAKGDVKERVDILGNNEISELAESFNIMADSLEKVDNTRREFISNVSHELRSPLTSIKGMITGISDGIVPKEKEGHYLRIVQSEVDRLSRLVNDLLDISSMEAGKLNLNIREFDINDLTTMCVLNMESKIKAKGIDVEVIFDEERIPVLADWDKLVQVFTNLLENAIKYGNDNGEIKLRTCTKGSQVLISIFNSGPTIPKDEINNIWERFYKIDKSRTNKVSTGLGLSIVRLILSEHNQEVWVKNIENKGVEFTFTLDRVE